jgi:hypothetical protein
MMVVIPTTTTTTRTKTTKTEQSNKFRTYILVIFSILISVLSLLDILFSKTPNLRESFTETTMKIKSPQKWRRADWYKVADAFKKPL